MKTRLLYLVGGLLLISSVAFSQDYVFKILTNSKGENTYKTSSSDWTPLKTGTKLNSGDEIKTTGDCYVVLLSSNGKLLELKEPKDYKVDELKSQVGGGDDGVISKYADFVMSKMSADSKEENRKKYASVTGATQRGFSQIKFFMASSANIYNSIAIIRWKAQDDATDYEISLMDWFGEPLMVAETSDSFYQIDFTDEKLKDLEMVIVNVSVKGEEETSSGDYAIQLVNTEDSKEYSVELETLKSSLDENLPISNLILAEFYEQNDLLLDALTSYERAIQDAPEIDYFKEAYREFLMRNGYNDSIE